MVYIFQYLLYLYFAECYLGFYGEGCVNNCSEHCLGADNSCHHVTGTCDLGCDPGYLGALCTMGMSQTGSK